MAISKESKQAGLGRRFFSYAPEDKRAKAEGTPRRGRFVPDVQDWARLRAAFHGNTRRMS